MFCIHCQTATPADVDHLVDTHLLDDIQHVGLELLCAVGSNTKVELHVAGIGLEGLSHTQDRVGRRHLHLRQAALLCHGCGFGGGCGASCGGWPRASAGHCLHHKASAASATCKVALIEKQYGQYNGHMCQVLAFCWHYLAVVSLQGSAQEPFSTSKTQRAYKLRTKNRSLVVDRPKC